MFTALKSEPRVWLCESSRETGLTERFYTLGCIGGAISPSITGLFVQLTAGTWRNMCWLLASLSATTLVLQILFVPDTAHERSPYALERDKSGRSWIFRRDSVNLVKCLEMFKDPKILTIVNKKLFPSGCQLNLK